MSGIISSIRNLFSREADTEEETEFIYFWDDTREEQLIEIEEKSLTETLEENLLLLVHILILVSTFPLVMISVMNGLNFLTIVGSLLLFGTVIISYFIIRNELEKPISVINSNLELLANNNFRGTDELLYSKEQYENLQELDIFRQNIRDTLKNYSKSSQMIQNDLLQLQNQMNNSYNNLNTINSQLEESLASQTNFQDDRRKLLDVSDGIDEFTANFDEALNGIEEISSIVSSIGKQTSMLALNAGIEAARAGKQGEGFEVVADNLRRLSQHAIKSSNEIDDLSKTISEQAKDSLEIISTGMRELEDRIIENHDQVDTINSELYQIVAELDTMQESLANTYSKASDRSEEFNKFIF